jgi:hypothetical protein
MDLNHFLSADETDELTKSSALQKFLRLSVSFALNDPKQEW